MHQYLIDSFNASPSQDFDKLTDQIPYKPLNFMIGQIAFGGRISDFLDSRCVSTIMSLILNKQLFDEEHQMCVQNQSYVTPPMDAGYDEVI